MRPLQHALLRAACQVQHWKEGGTTSSVEKKKAGGAEQYNANNKYTEAWLRRACAGHEGADVLHLHASPPLDTKEGLVRGCACRGTAGFRTCRAGGAGEFCREAEGNLGKGLNEGGRGGASASLCEQDYRRCKVALGWAC